MDLNLFATQIIQTGQKSSGSALLGGNNGLLGNNAGTSPVNVDFLSTLLGNIAQDDVEAKLDGDTKDTAAQVKNEKVDLALLQLALLGQDSNADIEGQLAELRAETLDNVEDNRVEQLTKLIEHLTSGLPADAVNEGASIEELVSRLTKRLEKLEASLEAFRTGDFGDEGAPFQALIATGLNPTQLTSITNRIEEVENKLGRKLTVEDLIAGVGSIIPVPGTEEDEDSELASTDALALLLNRVNDNDEVVDPNLVEQSSAPSTEKPSKQKDQQNDPIAALGISANNQLTNFINAANSAINKSVIAGDNTASSDGEKTPRLEMPQQLSNAEFKALFSNTPDVKNILAKINLGNITADAATPTLPKLGTLSFTNIWNEALSTMSGASVLGDAIGYDIQTGTPFTTTMQAAHAATTTTQAGQNHPATQMVTAHISKAAQKGEAGKITLQLDPPELGRVEVRLEFGDDRSVKAHLIVEKSETLLMLQRDASALDRALQNAGLDTDSSSLDYQMADENYGFGQDGQGGRDGQQHAQRDENGNLIDEDGEIIHTTMTWDVDPDTGHVHYNILA